MPHKNIDIPRLYMLICPDHRMVTHFDIGVRGIGGLIHAGQDMHIRSWALVIGIPFLFPDEKGVRYALHNGVSGVLYVDFSLYEGGDIVLVGNTAHELREPGPDMVPVEIA